MADQITSIVTLDEGQRTFRELAKRFSEKDVDWNEAETRFHFIDDLLTSCLGWPKSAISVEQHREGQYADYLLGQPVGMVWEAKREGTYFDLPAQLPRRHLQSLPSIMSVSADAATAIRQVQTYCVQHGAEFAVVCNGRQLIAFLAIRIGYPALDGNAFVLHDLDQMRTSFPTFWQNLSPDGVAERRLHRWLTTGSDVSLPAKPSVYLQKFPVVRYQSHTQSTLRSIAELIIEDIPENDDVEERFLRQCYCETGALSRDSLLSKGLLVARYAALFPDDEDHPRVEPASSQQHPLTITPEILTEALARRPIILLGDVGVGKTSFIKQLMLLRASREFENSINIYIDLGSKAALEADLNKFVLNEIDRQLAAKYDVDVRDGAFVRGVYDLEVKQFPDKHIRGSLFGR